MFPFLYKLNGFVSQLRSISLGRDAEVALEAVAEAVYVRKAAREGYIGDRSVCVDKEYLCFFQTVFLQELVRSFSV